MQREQANKTFLKMDRLTTTRRRMQGNKKLSSPTKQQNNT